jgi:hypothetical protein
MNLRSIRSKLDELRGVKAKTERDIYSLKNTLEEEHRNLRRHIQAREIVHEVGLKTQQQLEYHISNIVSLAEDSVFDEPYTFETEFIERRNQTECNLWFVRKDQRMRPVDAAGIGSVDVAGFALRLASWSMEKPRSRNTLIQDEPFKHLKGFDENVRVISMVKELSKKLNLQIIMVHDERVPFEEIEKGADKIFNVRKVDEVSKVTEL